MKHYRIPFTRKDGQPDTLLISEKGLIEKAMQRGGKYMDYAIKYGIMQVKTY